jgi:hypothetical protein
MAGDPGANIRRAIGNRLLILLMVSIILVVPAYAGISASFLLQYGNTYLSALYNPDYMIRQYIAIFNYWFYYKDQLPQEYALKVVGPPGGASWSASSRCSRCARRCLTGAR